MTVLLIKDVPDLPEDFDDVDATSEWCSNKSALLFPLSLMTSYIWKLVCNMTEQKELYTLANVEAPSGVPPENSDSNSELQSTAVEPGQPRQPRLLMDLSEIQSRIGEDSDFEGTYDDSNADFLELRDAQPPRAPNHSVANPVVANPVQATPMLASTQVLATPVLTASQLLNTSEVHRVPATTARSTTDTDDFMELTNIQSSSVSAGPTQPVYASSDIFEDVSQSDDCDSMVHTLMPHPSTQVVIS